VTERSIEHAPNQCQCILCSRCPMLLSELVVSWGWKVSDHDDDEDNNGDGEKVVVPRTRSSLLVSSSAAGTTTATTTTAAAAAKSNVDECHRCHF
jgi:hypothetical protein